VDAEGGDMKMMRWLVGVFIFLLIVTFFHGPPSSQAAVVSNPTCTDEHPWDRLKNAYRIEVLIMTQQYLLLAVWYTRDQIQPVLVRIELTSSDRISSHKTTYIVSD
jgi:hypothetical protein